MAEPIKMKPTGRCFAVAPSGAVSSEIRRSADGLLESTIRPLLSELEFEVFVAARKLTKDKSEISSIEGHVLDQKPGHARNRKRRPDFFFLAPTGSLKPEVSV